MNPQPDKPRMVPTVLSVVKRTSSREFGCELEISGRRRVSVRYDWRTWYIDDGDKRWRGKNIQQVARSLGISWEWLEQLQETCLAIQPWIELEKPQASYYDGRLQVHLARFADRRHFVMYYENPATGKRKFMSSGCTRKEEAEAVAIVWEDLINNGGSLNNLRRVISECRKRDDEQLRRAKVAMATTRKLDQLERALSQHLQEV